MSSLHGVRLGSRLWWELETGIDPESLGLVPRETRWFPGFHVPEAKPWPRPHPLWLSSLEPQPVPGTYRKVRPRGKKRGLSFEACKS